MTETTLTNTLICFTADNEKIFIKKLTDKGMNQETVNQLLLIIKAHICDTLLSPKKLN